MGKEAGKSKNGDVLISVGYANVLGYTLREFLKLLQHITIGTVLQIKVYRDFIDIPQEWQEVYDLIPETKLPVTFSAAGNAEDSVTSSDDNEDAVLERRFRHRYPRPTGQQPERTLASTSRERLEYERKSHAAPAGRDTDGAATIHRARKAGTALSAHWAAGQRGSDSSSSSASSTSGEFWPEAWAQAETGQGPRAPKVG
ncbi:PREDICTED: PDZ domain-containing protein 9 isoform X2 [Chinchilla lanigera]|uniref:PDZ domain-containing protein 9 isoform X2 n=1 Tax=Chinchilla lanigera TaxID=34839 RepID=UPI00038F0C6A|nr:PREDICTED: PDZ domain-containing protein 9 isoform X2 [Chinchilla lanigera]